jgi:hypothetical protein
MSASAALLLHKALQTLQPDERDELLHGLLLAQLGGVGMSAPAWTAATATAPRFTMDRERLASLLGSGVDASSSAGTRLKVLPVRLPEADYERLRDFCQASGFSMAVVIRTLVERFLNQHAGGSESA